MIAGSVPRPANTHQHDRQQYRFAKSARTLASALSVPTCMNMHDGLYRQCPLSSRDEAIGRQAMACFVRGGKMVARAGHPAGCWRGGRGCVQVSIVYGVGWTIGDRQFRFRKAILLGTLLVATVPTGRDHSGLLQADISQVKAQSRLFQTIPGAHRSRMACKRSGVRIPIAPPQVMRINSNTEPVYSRAPEGQIEGQFRSRPGVLTCGDIRARELRPADGFAGCQEVGGADAWSARFGLSCSRGDGGLGLWP
jgi:hypothetical protein